MTDNAKNKLNTPVDTSNDADMLHHALESKAVLTASLGRDDMHSAHQVAAIPGVRVGQQIINGEMTRGKDTISIDTRVEAVHVGETYEHDTQNESSVAKPVLTLNPEQSGAYIDLIIRVGSTQFILATSNEPFAEHDLNDKSKRFDLFLMRLFKSMMPAEPSALLEPAVPNAAPMKRSRRSRRIPHVRWTR